MRRRGLARVDTITIGTSSRASEWRGAMSWHAVRKTIVCVGRRGEEVVGVADEIKQVVVVTYS